MVVSYNKADPAADGPQDCGCFFLDALGPYARSQVQVRWRDEPRPRQDGVESLIDSCWTRRMNEAAGSGTKLFDAPLCRLIEYSRHGGELAMTLGPTCYRDFVGTNLHNAYLRYLHGPEVLANPLGVSGLVLARQEYILLGRRSSRVAYHPKRVQPIGGCVEPGPGDAPDPFGSLIREVHEEMGLEPKQQGELVCLGLVRDKHIVQPELVFLIPVDATVDQVRHQQLSAADHGEHTELVVVRNHPASIVTFMEANFADVTPVCLASLLLHGLQAWGSGWFASTRGYLRSLI